MRDLLRLVYLVVIILPLTLLLIGPALALAALRGRQEIGPIVLKPNRRGTVGRIGTLMLGLLVWLLVWGSLAAVVSGVILPAMGRSSSSAVKADVTLAVPLDMPTATPLPTSLPLATPTAPIPPTATHSPQQEEAISSPSPAPSPASTPSPLPPTPTSPSATPVPPTLTLAASTTATLAPAVTPPATLSPQEGGDAIAAIEAANELLRTAITESSIGNLAALETLWRGKALVKAQAFAQDFNQRYLRPLEVTCVYLTPPRAVKGDLPDTAYVISAEAWTYAGPKSTQDESFEFTYSLRREGDGWIIIDYDYGYTDVSSPSSQEVEPTMTPAPATMTEPTITTPTSQ
jgi:hypothetical protein